MTDDDDGKPYLMQLTEEMEVVKQALVMLRTENDELRRELVEARREASVATEQLAEQFTNASDQIRNEIQKVQETMMTADDERRRQLVIAMQQQREEILNSRLTERRIQQQLNQEALELWATKPEAERLRKIGWFRKEEDTAARDRFVRDYIDEHYESRLRAAYGEEHE
ncbi:hypothetical protein [Paenibacillus humicola]|uniref:hypothetical protein n=1 Tax=Paenibacillus humicola TaxID=3110540 RepID=UPI00237C1FE9|nr:hypothetical protein [Paenibacillus humicola]